MNKQEWRSHFKELRSAIAEDERRQIDAAITVRLCALPEFENCDLLLPYLSFGTEIETRAIIQAAWVAGKTVALPRCIEGSRNMKWYRVTSFNGLAKSSLGVEEPAEDQTNEINPTDFTNALCLVPGLTFDMNGYRMGYGGGFYDTFLQNFQGTSVGLCREVQFSEVVPALEAHDHAVNVVLTELRVIYVM